MLKAAGLAAGALILAALVPAPDERVSFLDVGQGDAILWQDRTVQVLVDGGPDTSVLRRLSEEMPWFDRRIEVVIATHPDQDHLAGLVHVLGKYEVGLVIMPKQEHDSGLQETWLNVLIEKQVPVRFAAVGQTLQAGGIRLEVLYPESGELTGDNNNNSVVVRADYNGTSWLLTGDATTSTERKMASRNSEILDVDVLKVGHHGSKSSTSEALLNAATPGAAVISVGTDNRYGHPTTEVLRRLEGVGVLRTDEAGTVRWRWAQDKWWVSCGAVSFTGKLQSC